MRGKENDCKKICKKISKWAGAEERTQDIKVEKACRTALILPILWLGEKTPPQIRGEGRLWILEIDDKKESYKESYVERLLWRPKRFGLTEAELEDVCEKVGAYVIVCGGVKPMLGKLLDIARVKRGYTKHYSVAAPRIWLEASGLGNYTWAVELDVSYNKYLMEEVKELKEDVLLYDPPDTFVLTKDFELKRL